jgi:hypothetical protein
MTELKNPDTVLIKNHYYPSGLTEGEIWNYFQKNKLQILKETNGRDVIIWIANELNSAVVKRKINNEPIRLTNDNYESVIHGRVISVHSVMKFYEDICIIDIDTDSYDAARRATHLVYESSLKIPITNKTEIYFTGKTSFHIKCYISRKTKIDTVRFLLANHFKYDSNLSNYTVSNKRNGNTPNIDLYSNKLNGSFITPNSLSVIGLKCMKIKPEEILTFNPSNAKI